MIVTKSDTGDSASLALVELNQEAVIRSSVRTLDFSRGHASIEFKGAEAEILGADGSGWSAMESLMDRAAVMFAWEQVGIADAALERARDYAMGRYAFGRAIASYQAIKHKLADMYVKTLWQGATAITVHGRSILIVLNLRWRRRQLGLVLFKHL